MTDDITTTILAQKPEGRSPSLQIACPVCAQPAGAYCRKPDGVKKIITHKERREAYNRKARSELGAIG